MCELIKGQTQIKLSSHLKQIRMTPVSVRVSIKILFLHYE